MVGNVIIDAMAGYGLARTEFFGKNIIFAMYLATMMIGIEVLMVPQFLIVRYLGLYDSFPAIVLPGLASPFSIFLMRQFFLNFPREIEESAFVDGASRFRIFCSIALPTAKPVLATVAVIHFLAGWESFIWPLIVTSTAGRWAVMQVVIARATQKISAFIPAEAGINYPMVMAASFISAIPMLFVFLFAQRFFIHGLSAGALKG
jgi:multiple sugar transport system permease protein